MPGFIITGQPPDHDGRLAVGPFPSRQAADEAWLRLHGLGWQQVWRLPIDAETTEQLTTPAQR